MRRKNILYLLTSLLLCLLLTACNETTCAYCGKSKQCKEYNILGTKRNICKDCINNPAAMSSNSVINEYQAEPIEPGLISTPSDNETKPTDDQSILINNNTPPAANSNSASNNSSSSNNNLANNSNPTNSSISKDAVINSLAAKLANYSLQISPDASDKTLYNLYNINGNDIAIDLIVTTDSDKIKLTLNKYPPASDSDMVVVCINSILASINSSDYDGLGRSIYDNAVSYGNYSANGCSFYYSNNNSSNSTGPDQVLNIVIQQ